MTHKGVPSARRRSRFGCPVPLLLPRLPLSPPRLPLSPPRLPLSPPRLPLSPPRLPLSPPRLPLSGSGASETSCFSERPDVFSGPAPGACWFSLWPGLWLCRSRRRVSPGAALLLTGRAFLLPRFFAFPGVMALTARFATGIAARAVLAATLASRAGTFAAGRGRGPSPNKKAPEFPQALFENCCS